MNENLYIIDGNAPFFTICETNSEQNWSKIPFHHIDGGSVISEKNAGIINESFEKYCSQIVRIGYNTITLDDLPHFIIHGFYNKDLINRLESYRKLYHSLLDIAEKYGLKVYVNTDIMFFSEDISNYCRGKKSRAHRVLSKSIKKLFTDFPKVEGIIFRVGETDGKDVKGDFLSQLMIKTPKDLRNLIRNLLPIFENNDKNMIVRTWSLGAYPIGDLMWNQDTYDSVFNHIESDNLIISFKFGETDFFRYLNFNKIFYESGHWKIIELQTRREYEGFGEFPSYIGRDYKKYARYISNCPNIRGTLIWCQTGGWSHFTKLTFLDGSSLWNEINTHNALKIFKDGMSVEEAISDFMQSKYPHRDAKKMVTLLTLSNKVIKQLWYLPEFSMKRLYFRRTRVPSILWIFWDNILINHTLRKIIRRFVHERREAVQEGYRHLKKIKQMKTLAEELSLDTRQFDFMYDTFHLVAMGREYYLGPWKPELVKAIEEEVEIYNSKYPHGFHVHCDFNPVQFKKWLIKSIFKISLRPHPQYRLFDRLFLLRFASLIYPIFRLWEKYRAPDFAKEQAMGINTLFK